MNKTLKAILPGPRTSFLDHLAPLCQILEMPLICTDSYVQVLAEIYYPKLDIILCEDENSFQMALEEATHLFYVEPSRLGTGAFKFDHFLYKGKAKGICGLHGTSDKYRLNFGMERYADEETLLLYGSHMSDFFKEKCVLERIKNIFYIGNYRYPFYIEHQSFFTKIARPFTFPKNNKKTILYAPTWTHTDSAIEDYSPFFDIQKNILESVPDDFQVIVKPHPYFFRMYPQKISQVKEYYKNAQNILFLDEIPLVYPLLECVDIYLGDYSSVGYDFLKMDRPLYFTNHKKRNDEGVFLYSCGTEIFDYSTLYDVLREKEREDLSAKRKELYRYAFGEDVSLAQVKQTLFKALS